MAAAWQKSIGLKNGGNQGFRFVSLFFASFPFSESTLSVTERLRLTLRLLEEKDPNCSRRIWRKKWLVTWKVFPKYVESHSSSVVHCLRQESSRLTIVTQSLQYQNHLFLNTLFYTNIHSGVRLERNEITNKITFFEINIICLKYYDWLSSAVKLCKWFTVSIFSLTLSYMHGTNKEFCNLSLYRVYL